MSGRVCSQRRSPIHEVLEAARARKMVGVLRVCDRKMKYRCIVPFSLECRLRTPTSPLKSKHSASTTSMAEKGLRTENQDAKSRLLPVALAIGRCHFRLAIRCSALQGEKGALIWPFDGGLEALIQGQPPRNLRDLSCRSNGHVEVRFPPRASKQRQSRPARRNAPLLSSFVETRHSVQRLRCATLSSMAFGPFKSGDRPFRRPPIGLLGMIDTVTTGRRTGYSTSVEAS